MHDQKKIREADVDSRTKQLEKEKIERFRQLYAECVALRDDGASSVEAMERVAVLLEINPELYTMYNYRRRTLQAWWSAFTEAEAAVERKAQLLAELELSNRIIQKEYKCYAAWLHRKWVLRHLDPESRLAIMVKENAKCQALLKLDERNFHVWGYRRWVTQHLDGTPHYSDEVELAFTEAKIGANFSNYSAWHNRALVLNSLIAKAKRETSIESASTVDELVRLYNKDCELVTKAMYCDPEDQSAWLYARTQIFDALRQLRSSLPKSLLRADDESGSAGESVTTAITSKLETVYRSCVMAGHDACEELITTEDSDLRLKWPRWLLMHLLGQHGDQLGLSEQERSKRRSELLRELAEIDPQRRGYFADMAASFIPFQH